MLPKLETLSQDEQDYIKRSNNPETCAAWIVRTHKDQEELREAICFLEQLAPINSLEQALLIFDASHYPYRRTHFHYVQTLAEVLANPLAQTIFSARLRCFGWYATPSDPLESLDNIDKFIEELYQLKTEDEKIRYFFDYFAILRPHPFSQRDIEEINIDDTVCAVLSCHCEALVQSVQTAEECEAAKRFIRQLRFYGGDRVLFNKLKYQIASQIESKESGVTRRYDELMDDIWQHFQTPKPHMIKFSKMFVNSQYSAQPQSLITMFAVPVSSSFECLVSQEAMQIQDSNQFQST
ncbi:hypothetical protein [Legionella impletisoli]|nr:hypothetical protein [Legionella impletisoli]